MVVLYGWKRVHVGWRGHVLVKITFGIGSCEGSFVHVGGPSFNHPSCMNLDVVNSFGQVTSGQVRSGQCDTRVQLLVGTNS